MNFQEKSALLTQRFLAQVFILPVYFLVSGWMRWVRGYHIENLASVRARFQSLIRSGDKSAPVLICSNHLTMIDSFLIIWSLGSPGCYIRQFHRFPWNLPEKGNFSGNIAIRLLCYLGKCIPVIRKGPRETIQRVFQKILHVLSLGDYVMVFPEGGRGRNEKIDRDSCTYGVGQMALSCPKARVVAVYLRGNGQKHYSFFPKKNDRFRVLMEEVKPDRSVPGLRGARQISFQIMDTLIDLEQDWFSSKSSES